MANITIDSVSIAHEYPFEFLRDGTEEPNFGTIKLFNSSQRSPYPDYADVEVDINGTTYEAIIQKDLVTRTALGKYQHDIILAEVVLKLAGYIHPDRLFTTIDGSKITYLTQLEHILISVEMNATSPFTIASATQTILGVNADEKEYSGGDLLTTLTDMFRSVGAYPTLSLNNVIGHELIGDLGSQVTITNSIGEIIESDISDYAMAVHSKVKNATYETDLINGGTFYPNATDGVTPRSSDAKYSDSEAEWQLDSGIRRFIDVRMKNLQSQTEGTLTAADLTKWIVSKEEWDGLAIERTTTTLYAGLYRNNTLYYTEGDNVIKNAGVRYNNSAFPISGLGQQVIDALIHSFWVDKNGTDSEFNNQTLKEMEIGFYYQPIRDLDVRQERHSIDKVVKNAVILNQQKDSKLELSRYGEANKSLINRLGNDKFDITVRYKTDDTLFDLYDYTDEDYKIIKIKYLIRYRTVDVTYHLVKGSSVLNPNTQINRSISPFTITKRNILTCYVENEYIEFSRTQRTDTSNVQGLAFRQILMNAFAYSGTQDKPIYNAQFISISSGNKYINSSVQRIPMGTSMVFNMQFQSPSVAGYQLVDDTGYLGSRLKPIPYTDEYGQVGDARVYFGHTATIDVDLHPVSVSIATYYMGGTLLSYDLNPNEIFGKTHIQHCITSESNLIVGDFFAKNNSLMRELGLSQGITVFEYPTSIKHTIDDKYRKSGSTGTGTVSLDITGYEYLDVSTTSGTNWVIAKSTAPYDIYFAFNNQGSNLSRIYINLMKTRPNTETL